MRDTWSPSLIHCGLPVETVVLEKNIIGLYRPLFRASARLGADCLWGDVARDWDHDTREVQGLNIDTGCLRRHTISTLLGLTRSLLRGLLRGPLSISLRFPCLH